MHDTRTNHILKQTHDAMVKGFVGVYIYNNTGEGYMDLLINNFNFVVPEPRSVYYALVQLEGSLNGNHPSVSLLNRCPHFKGLYCQYCHWHKDSL